MFFKTPKIEGFGMKEVKVKHLPACQQCLRDNIDREATYDVKTIFRFWMYLCEEHYDYLGIGLGTGIGQKLIEEEKE